MDEMERRELTSLVSALVPVLNLEELVKVAESTGLEALMARAVSERHSELVSAARELLVYVASAAPDTPNRIELYERLAAAWRFRARKAVQHG